MSAPSLSNFASELRTRNIARPNLYHVEILPPGSTESSKLVSMWCSSAQTPQVDILTNDAYLDNGTRRKYAYDVEYQNLVLSFFIDQEYNVKKFFDDWNFKIIKNKRNFNFPDKYTSDALKLFILNQNDEDTYSYQYNRIYPKTIQSVELSYANGTTYSTLSVEFVYETFYTASYAANGSSSSSKPEPEIGDARSDTLNNEVSQEIGDRFNGDAGINGFI